MLFGPAVGFEVFHQLNNLAEYFFGWMTSETKYRNCQIPTIDGSWLVNGIQNKQLQPSPIRPALFGGKKEPSVLQPKVNNSSNNRKKETTSKRQLKTANTKPEASKTLSAEVKKILVDHKDKGAGPLTVATIKESNNISSLQELSSMIELNGKTDCMCYHLLGSCPGCNREHKLSPKYNQEQALCLLKKATKQ